MIRQPVLIRTTAILFTTILMTSVIAGTAAAAQTTITPSAMRTNSLLAGGPTYDPTAGTVMRLSNNGTITMPIAPAGTATLTVRARADLCKGSPVATLKAGGAILGTIDVTSSSWATYRVSGTVPPGPNTLTIEYANDYFEFLRCDRNLYVASVTIDDAGAPESCPANQFRARYFNNTTATGSPVAVQCENAPGGSFTGSPLPGVNADNFSVEYSGAIDVPATADHIVSTTLGNVGARVWIDDDMVLDKWTPQWGTTNITRPMTQGRHQVRATYFNTSGIAHFGLSLPRATPGPASNNGNYFAADSFWNRPVPPNAIVDPRSAGWITTLDSTTSDGVWINSTDWSTTVYNAPPGTPTTNITVTNSNRTVTIPYLPSYQPTRDADAHLAVIDDATGCLYEFQSFNASAKSAIAQATYKAYTGSGGHTAGPSHAGGEFSYLAGMITPQDVASGVIDHALRYAIPLGAPSYVYPGTRTDGSTIGGVPQGTRLQLDPNLDLNQFGLSPFQLMVARALQQYGGYNADGASGVFALYARSTVDGTTYPQPIQPLPDALVRHMRFLAPSTSSTEIYLDRADDPTCNQQR
ncbi:PA14 domain protein OS=Tsukamurella paurometabola (strain ATCC 8368 / DSM / CCUG 35730 / CIP 100753 / JCM 10117 / KCTC 9821 / NBRC 16120 / NCIMB 702349/ NCTC 13040) OX=521096 GN=Tpau_1348 PE=4 SV=1 [Tsukamurella paurometabola]|uniref:PA14 domain protein n=1 Tax=Tsukamurella paurometabola (strain ATCC 8368 / DSM 20162 / CCUG 35730 / CIP 100753 / JCM 10117 / KCTC 9821 / NBRC 16120 / NCIMB 702349 / NCTC 13040) TaxID=521096 RepID=D5UWV5_TSUPD|nr:carbohydrate-binding domain-containing protein [Tsukamurella paurometabola]ADG77977.1 PA14 domain protein [Tsukamurella paurometabola DSM 20162]SUP29610.1 PA14 domain [Tsukamurella paurometabola]